MREFDVMKDMIYDEIEEISRRGQLNKDAICVVGELVDILKDIGTIEMFEEGIQVPEDDYSFATEYGRGGYSQRRGRGNGSYVGNSYRSGQPYYGYSRRGRGGYSREDGKQHMIDKLNHLMNEADNEEDRNSIRMLIQ